MKWAKSYKGHLVGSNIGRWGDWALRFWAKLVDNCFCGIAELVCRLCHKVSWNELSLLNTNFATSFLGLLFVFAMHLHDAEQGINEPHTEEILSLWLRLSVISVQQIRVAVEGMHGNTACLENLTTIKIWWKFSVREGVIYILPPNCREQMQAKRKTTPEVFEGLKIL